MSGSNSLVRHRQSAYQQQQGCCFYCHAPMWQSDPDFFVKKYELSLRLVAKLKCTAEHLKARCEGGSDDPQNIVAACLRCNELRHRMRPAPSPDAYCKHVRKMMAAKSWWPRKLRERLGTLRNQRG